MVLDALRHWVLDMHVDGFRFDLGAALARDEKGAIDMESPLICALRDDPVLSGVKLIMEPWDLGPDGYQVGAFPVPFREWNGRFRDTVRGFWRGEGGMIPQLATRICGSSDMFSWNGRPPQASINFITAHDGFTLADLTAYSRKHNLGNRENNRDGADRDGSSNCGEEGETDLDSVNKLRSRLQKSLAVNLLFATGVPMILAGDEFLRTQRGNNNCYCQDNRLSWIDWDVTDAQVRFFEFLSRLLSLRRSQPFLQRERFYTGEKDHSGLKDLSWFATDGSEISGDEWQNAERRELCILFSGTAAGPLPAVSVPGKIESATGADGQPFLLLFNASQNEINFTFPAALEPIIKKGGRIRPLFDTGKGGFTDHSPAVAFTSGYRLAASGAAGLLVEK
jgi:glycogen operon protein